MASIFFREDRPNRPHIVSYDEPGHSKRIVRQRSFKTVEDAKLFKAQIELEILKWDKENQSKSFTSIPKSNLTFSEYVKGWLPVYAKKYWQPKTHNACIGYLNNHIIPILGKKNINDIAKRDIEEMVDILRNTKISGSRVKNISEDKRPYLSSATVQKMFNLAKVVFDSAFIDDVATVKIFEKIKKPKAECNHRVIWTSKMIDFALDNMKDPLLHLFVNMAYLCSGRNGEVVGLTWDCIDFDEVEPKIYINKTLQRVDDKDIEVTGSKEILFVFPKTQQDSKSVLVLKEPKTDKSERRLSLPNFLVKELLERKKRIELQKEILGICYNDHNLVFCLDNGNPIEPTLMLRRFQKWQNRNPDLKLPSVDAHSLRHTGVTYAYKASQNNVHAAQNRAGHASATTTNNVYIHYDMDEDIELTRTMEKHYREKNRIDKSKEDSSDKILQSIKNDPELLSRVVNMLQAER